MKTLKQIKSENPTYDSIPDLVLADKLYEKYESKVDKETFFKGLFPEVERPDIENINMTPYGTSRGLSSAEAEKERAVGAASGDKDMSFRPKVSEIAEANEVDVNNPAFSEARFAGSLGFNEEQKINAIKTVLDKSYKQNIEVRYGPNTGELEYLNPETNKYSLVNKPGFDFGDIAGSGGDAMVIIPDIAATIGVGIATGGTGAIPAGAAAAAVGEYSRLKLGQKLYGINKNVSDKQMFIEGSKAGGLSLAGGYGGLFIAKGIKGANNLINGRPIVADDLAKIFDDKQIADNVANQINTKLDDANISSKLKFTLAQAQNNPELLAAQSSFENTARLGYMGEFRDFNVKQAESLNDYFKLIKSGFNTKLLGTNQPVNAFDAGKLIQEVAEKRNQPIINDLIAKQSTTEEMIEKGIIGLPDGSERLTGIKIRDFVSEISTKFKEDAAVAAKKLDEAGATEVIGADIIQATLKTLDGKTKTNLLKSPKVSDLFKDMFKVTGPQKITMESARNTLSSLKTLVRAGEKGGATENLDIGALKSLIGSFNKQINKDASKAYISELDNFNQFYKINKNKLDNSIIGEITRVNGGRLRIADEDVFPLTFKKGKNSARFAEELHDVIQGSPDAMLAYKNSIFDFYKNKVIKNGKVNVNSHNSFMKDYESPLKLFFNKTEYNKITKIGGLQKYVNDITNQRTVIEKQLKNSFEGTLLNTRPQEIVNKIFNVNNIGDIKNLKTILKQDPEVLSAFQSSVLTEMNERIFIQPSTSKLGIKQLDPGAFNTFLNGPSGEKGFKTALEEVFDKKFVDNLQILNNALQISSRKASPAQTGVIGNVISDIIRARVGQFTTAGRTFTAARRIFQGTAYRVVKNALLNPQSLDELIQLRKLKPNTKKAAYILGKLEGLSFMPEQE